MSRPTILLTGATGQLGSELSRLLSAHGEVTATDRAQLDLTDVDAIVSAVRALRPRLIVNAAGYTAVDQAEREPELADAVNARAPAVLAEEAKRTGALLIHYSTDYVFDGTAVSPYPEDVRPNPINAYGRSKLRGEEAITAIGGASLIFRTSWIYGLHGQNFLLTIRRLASEREELRIVADQYGVPNWSHDLAQATSDIVARGASAMAERMGVYHLSARGSASWFEFARAIVGPVDRPRVTPIATAEYPTLARRPAYAVLATRKLEESFGIVLPEWRESLARCLSNSAGQRR